jgi:amino acid adenylation domain-containing protein
VSWRSVVERFEEVAATHPGRPALAGDGARLTFGELATRTAAVAAGLAIQGVGVESLVGLLLPRGVDLVVGLLGTLRSGASYLPLDPALPIGRLRYMCAQADPEVLLTDAAARRGIPPDIGRRRLTVRGCAVAGGVVGPRRREITPGQRAYAIYTSGSTGHPKAVEVTHGSLASLLDGLAPVIGPAPARVGWNASPSFDASVQQWLRLCRGDTVVLISDRVREDPRALAALIAEEELSELDITPSHLASLLEHLPSHRGATPLRLLIGGEAITPGLWRTLADQATADALTPINLYGPTECTVDATYAWIDAGRPHLGGPLPGTRVYLLSEVLTPTPLGADGELYLAGAGVSRGYLGLPALTAQRFVADVASGDGGRMYRTGDRARLGRDGRLEYLGRSDDQVKLRGYRIELGEIEAVLSRCPGVIQAVAVLRDDMPGGPGLVGYCVPARTTAGGRMPLDTDAVRRRAAEQLPGYMVPTAIVGLERLPLTISGKVDRAALPEPARPHRFAGEETAPRTATEHLLAAAWCELLGVDQVGVDDHFFELGGQSLLAIRLVAHLRRKGCPATPLVAVFRHPVLRRLAAYLDEEWSGDGRRAGAPEPPQLALSTTGRSQTPPRKLE